MDVIILNIPDGETSVKNYVNMNDIVRFHETTIGSIVYTRVGVFQVIEKPDEILKQINTNNNFNIGYI